MAATTSIAGDVDATWKGLLNGESGIDVLEDSFIEEYDLPVRIGGHLKVSPDTLLSRVEIRRMAYVERLATVLGREVWKNAGSPEVDNDRLGVAIGTGLGGGDALIDSVDKLKNGGYRKVSPLAVQMVMPNGPVGGRRSRAEGPRREWSLRSRRARRVRRPSPTRGG